MRIVNFAFEPLLSPDITGNGNGYAEIIRAPVSEAAILPPAPPTFSEEELDAAKRAAYEEGYMAGKAEALRESERDAAQLQQEISAATAQVTAHLESLSQQHQQYIIAKQSELGRLVLGCAERLAVEALRKEPLADIQAMVNDCLGLMLGKPEVVVQVNPKLQSSLAKQFGNRVKVEGVPDMNPVDCRISWSYGEASREIDNIWHQIEETIDRYFAISATEMSQQVSAQPSTTDADILTISPTDLPPEGENHG